MTFFLPSQAEANYLTFKESSIHYWAVNNMAHHKPWVWFHLDLHNKAPGQGYNDFVTYFVHSDALEVKQSIY